MRISVSANSLSDNGLLTPIDPPPPLDIDDLFELELFRTSKTTFFPFEEIDVQWSIRAKTANTEFDDYLFTLVATDNILVNDLPASGMATFSPHKNTLLKIQGRHRTRGGVNTLGQGIALSVDESSCLVREFPRVVFDDIVNTALTGLTSQTAEIRLQGEVRSTWKLGSIEYYFPLELVLNNFFNGDLDVKIELTFAVHHNGSQSELEVNIDHASDVNFHGLEDVLSLGSSAIIAATANRMVPLILECEMRQQEIQVVRSFMAFLRRDLDTHRLLAVRVAPLGNSRLANIAFVLCPLPVEPEPIVPDAPRGGELTPPI